MQQQPLVILHFNDVYDIQEQVKDPVGGVPRFTYTLNKFQEHFNCLTLFSGDIFSPSALSNIYRGEQMIKPIHRFKIDVACPGNHDFDYPLEKVETLLKHAQIPWILSNVFNAETNSNFAHTLPYYIKECNINQIKIKIGFLGLAEKDWLNEIVEVPQELIAYEDYLHCAERTVQTLKQDCDIIIALTHMRVPHDHDLINNIQGIDLILGGHDHMIYCEKIQNSLFMKSGTNFKNLGIIKLTFNKNEINSEIKQFITEQITPDENSIIFTKEINLQNHQQTLYLQITMMNIISSISQDIEMQEYVNEKIKEYNIEKSKPICYSLADLECTFHVVRNKETNLANFYADLLKLEFETEIAYFNSGTLRADDIIHKGILTFKELDKIYAIPDLLTSFYISGRDLLQTLENSYKKYLIILEFQHGQIMMEDFLVQQAQSQNLIQNKQKERELFKFQLMMNKLIQIECIKQLVKAMSHQDLMDLKRLRKIILLLIEMLNYQFNKLYQK